VPTGTSESGHGTGRRAGKNIGRLALRRFGVAELDRIRLLPCGNIVFVFGRKSVKARMKNLCAEERREIARNATKIRWSRPKSKKTKVRAG
jgi:hypothetical protein